MSSRVNIFISWSGEQSRMIAESLKSWLPLIIDSPDLWISSRDLPEGKRWSDEVFSRLEMYNFGILIITPTSINSPWVLFEAGALLKKLNESTIIPYLAGVKFKELSNSPLSQFQGVEATREGTERIVKSINQNSDNPVDENILKNRINAFWPEFETKISKYILPNEESEKADKNTKENTENEIVGLKLQIDDLTKMIKQIVNSSTFTFSDIKPKELEGAWYNPDSGAHLYSRLIDGVLHTPYCYDGDNELTAAYFDWKKVGEYWYARFEWVSVEISGFAFYKLVSSQEIQGSWWHNDGSIEVEAIENSGFDPNKNGGVPVIWRKMPDKAVPEWAEEYFKALKIDSFKNVWENITKKSSGR